MGRYKNSSGIDCYEPDSDENTLYIQTSFSQITLEELWEQIKFHFGENVSKKDFTISSELIHTRCLGYDMMDWGDWDDYLIISKVKE